MFLDVISSWDVLTALSTQVKVIKKSDQKWPICSRTLPKEQYSLSYIGVKQSPIDIRKWLVVSTFSQSAALVLLFSITVRVERWAIILTLLVYCRVISLIQEVQCGVKKKICSEAEFDSFMLMETKLCLFFLKYILIFSNGSKCVWTQPIY